MSRIKQNTHVRQNPLPVSPMPDSPIDEWGRYTYALMKAIPRDKDGNPMTLEGAIRSIILKSPSYCGYRDQALDTLYCVLGSGIDWNEHGRLGDRTPNNYMSMPPDHWSCSVFREKDFGQEETLKSMRAQRPGAKSKPANWNNYVDAFEKRLKADHLREVQQAIKTVQEIDLRCQTYKGGIRWYPISWYACHLCVPINAQADFVEGAIETVKRILGTKLRHRRMGDLTEWRRQMDNRDYAKWLLEILENRKLILL